jgi:mannose-6-phosphate isomerase-like protein (cupin superfamily)
MKIANIHSVKDWFEVLQTTSHSQTAVMKLPPGQASGEEAESHEESEQLLLLLEGQLLAEISGHKSTMHSGDVIIIPARRKHKFTNNGEKMAITFNVYCPPEYPPDQKG